MKVFTIRAHDNQFGTKYRKAPGDVYEHPQPTADLAFEYVREATKEEIAAVAKSESAAAGGNSGSPAATGKAEEADKGSKIK